MSQLYRHLATEESVGTTLIVLKIVACRRNSKAIAAFLKEIQPDFLAISYGDANERLAFFVYNRFTYRFVKTSILMMALVSSMYYTKALITSLEIAGKNSSHPIYRAPFKTYMIFQPQDYISYICLCFYQIFAVLMLICGSAGFDCLVVTLVLHLSGQFAVLTCRVNNSLRIAKNFRHEIKSLVQRHQHLIRLANVLEDRFNSVILHHLLGTIFNLCFVGYHTFASSANGTHTKWFIYVCYIIVVLSMFFIYCYIGECLTSESTNFGESFYHYEWYNVSPTDLKMMRICMARAKKPLQLTSGKFCALSFYTFTDVLKTSMGYLSVLRTFA